MIGRWSLIVLGLLLAACTVSPTGRQQLVMVPAGELDAMGATAFQDVKRSKKVVSDARVNGYVRCVAGALIAETEAGRDSWEVRVFQDDSANAFALPGGKIGINTGLLVLTDNQAQLAAVIGHEIGHVLANHANERVSQDLLVQSGLAVAGSSGLGPEMMGALGLGAQVGVLLPFSRVHEQEADIIGIDLMARAGFDPRQGVELWRAMSQAGGGQPPELLSTHPAHGARIRELQRRLGQAMQTYRAAQGMGKRPDCGAPPR
jgi:predicted Zn-dependent protease